MWDYKVLMLCNYVVIVHENLIKIHAVFLDLVITFTELWVILGIMGRELVEILNRIDVFD